MKLMYDDKGTCAAIMLENRKEMAAIIELIAAAFKGDKPLNKRSNAYKLAKVIDDELPIF